MSADGNLLQGQVTDNPITEEKDVERLLKGFLEALLMEQEGDTARPADARPRPPQPALPGDAR